MKEKKWAWGWQFAAPSLRLINAGRGSQPAKAQERVPHSPLLYH
jgi:hypothetical protein